MHYSDTWAPRTQQPHRRARRKTFWDPYSPCCGIWNNKQAAAWTKVNDEVYVNKGFIFCQMWFLRRVAKPEMMIREGYRIVSASAVPYADEKPVLGKSIKTQTLAVVEGCVHTARNAIAAVFDRIEIHGANGYIMDQFQQSTSNKRTDTSSGSVEKRARLPLLVVHKVVAAQKVGMRLSSHSGLQAMRMSGFKEPSNCFATQLREHESVYFHLAESIMSSNTDVEPCCGYKFLINT